MSRAERVLSALLAYLERRWQAARPKIADVMVEPAARAIWEHRRLQGGPPKVWTIWSDAPWAERELVRSEAAAAIAAAQVGGTVGIAWCPEHGLHGERGECFVCGGPVLAIPMAPKLREMKVETATRKRWWDWAMSDERQAQPEEE